MNTKALTEALTTPTAVAPHSAAPAEAKSKHQLVALLKHEFKSPLACLQSYLNTLEGDLIHLEHYLQHAPPPSLKQAKSHLTEAQHSLESLLQVMESAMAPTQGETLTLKPLCLAWFLQQQLPAWQQLYPQVAISLHLHTPTPASLLGHEGLLGQVLHNLLHNAVDALATTKQPMLQVTLSLLQGSGPNNPQGTPPQLSLCVVDNGPGIAPQLQSKVLQKHFSTKPPKHGHQGLGLSVVQSIAQQLGGGLTIHSPHPLPVTPPAPTAPNQPVQHGAGCCIQLTFPLLP